MDLFDRFDACLLCGSHHVNPLQGYEKNYLVKCAECRFVFCNRRPTLDELKAHYHLYPRANSISEITLKRYDELLDTFEKYRNTNNLIDVGCGDGFFLMAAKKRNWNVFGTEFTPEAIEVCQQKGIQMTKSPLNSNNYPDGYFDIITSFEVIEHINEPLKELLSFYKILRAGGVVYVTTPNFNSISRNMVGARWNIIEYPEHLTYYTKRTLTKLLRDSKFNLLEIKTTGISLSRISRSSGGIVAGESSPQTDEVLRQKAEEKFIFRMLKGTINFFLDLFGKGDAMKAYFQKQ